MLTEALFCLAATIYFEARGEPETGQIAVAQVVMNRAETRNQSICDVVKSPGQFSWVPSYKDSKIKKDSIEWKKAYNIATIVYDESIHVPDLVKGAEYFKSGRKTNTFCGVDHVVTIGRHHFYGT